MQRTFNVIIAVILLILVLYTINLNSFTRDLAAIAGKNDQALLKNGQTRSKVLRALQENDDRIILNVQNNRNRIIELEK